MLSWTLNGPVASQATSRRVISHFVSSMAIEKKLDTLWEMESYDEQHSFSPDDARVKKLWDKKCRVWTATLNFLFPGDTLHYHCQTIFTCLNLGFVTYWSLKKKKMLSQYETEIEKMISNGYAEPVPDDVMCAERCFYLPHHALMADITSMYKQMKILTRDKDALRFFVAKRKR